jgi:hypothetical protein
MGSMKRRVRRLEEGMGSILDEAEKRRRADQRRAEVIARLDAIANDVREEEELDWPPEETEARLRELRALIQERRGGGRRWGA